jgi:hypothetical protein
VNPVRGVLRHLAAPEALVATVGPVPFEYDFASLVDGFGPLVPHEDFVGNPVHAALALCAVLGLAARWRRVGPRARWAVPSLVAAWVLFHAVFRDNAYLGRLQLPLFALWPAFLAVVPRGAWPARVTGAAAAAAVALALWVGVRNHARPPLAAEVGPRTLTYYRTFGAERPRTLQLEVMKVAERTECRRIGIFMGENGFDYPLTWLSMLRGAEVRHLLAADPWPCLVYAEPGSWPGWGLERPDVALSPAQWTLAGVFGGTPYLFVRKPAAPGSRAAE